MNCKQLLSIAFIPLFIILQGCQNQTVTGKPKLSCADSSTVKLDPADVKEIVLTPTGTNYAGVAENNRSKGYKFVGKKGQKIGRNTKPNGFCTWLYSSDNQIINDNILPQDGTYVIQVAEAENSGTFEIAMSLGSDNPPPSASPPPEQPSPSPSLASTSDMTKDEATKLISTWLEAKKSIFGFSYNKDLGRELTIGQAYERNITANPGDEESSIDYFKGRGEYYTYERQEIHDILAIRTTSPNEVLVKALVSEYRTVHRSSGSSSPEKTTRSPTCYLFQKDGSSWKIARDPSILKSCD
jgi:ARC6-like, IMS domain